MGTGSPLGLKGMFWNYIEVTVHNTINVQNATEKYTLK